MYLSASSSSVIDRFVNRATSILAALLIVLATAMACAAQAGVLSEDARRDTELRPGVVRVIIRLTAAFQGIGCKTGVAGTGFLYRPDGYLITNGHVAQIANQKDEDALLAQRKIAFEGCLLEKVERTVGRRLDKRDQAFVFVNMKVEPELTVMLDNGATYDGEIKAYSDPITSGGKDVAIIKIDANNLPTVPLGDSDAVNVNDRVYVIGYPGAADISSSSALVATSSDGIISAVKAKDASDSPLLQTNANINHGNSGGPAFNAAGEAIGIATFGKEVPGYNFLVPISTAKEFVRQAGAEPMRGNFDKVWHQALEAYSNQDWDTAHKLLTDVLEMMPNQPEAQKLQLQAAANQRAETPFHRAKNAIGVPGTIILCLIVLLIVGLLIWLLMRKPQQPAPIQAYKAEREAIQRRRRAEPRRARCWWEPNSTSLHLEPCPRLLSPSNRTARSSLAAARSPAIALTCRRQVSRSDAIRQSVRWYCPTIRFPKNTRGWCRWTMELLLLIATQLTGLTLTPSTRHALTK